MSECLSSYPTELPLGCVQQLIDIVRAGTIQERAQEFAAAVAAAAAEFEVEDEPKCV